MLHQQAGRGTLRRALALEADKVLMMATPPGWALRISRFCSKGDALRASGAWEEVGLSEGICRIALAQATQNLKEKAEGQGRATTEEPSPD